MRQGLALAALLLTAPGGAVAQEEAAPSPAHPGPSLTIMVEGLRSQKGQFLICLTRDAAHFPDCSGDKTGQSRHFVVPATAGAIALGSAEPGDYAIAIVHDENGNGRLDTMAGIPREGVGFSRNPMLFFGPPAYRSARFPIGEGPVQQRIKIKYFL